MFCAYAACLEVQRIHDAGIGRDGVERGADQRGGLVVVGASAGVGGIDGRGEEGRLDADLAADLHLAALRHLQVGAHFDDGFGELVARRGDALVEGHILIG